MGKIFGWVLVLIGIVIMGSPVLNLRIPLVDTLAGPIVGAIITLFGAYQIGKTPRM